MRKDQLAIGFRSHVDWPAERRMYELVICIKERVLILEVMLRRILSQHQHLQIHFLIRRDNANGPRYVIAEAGETMLRLILLLPYDDLIDALLMTACTRRRRVGNLLKCNRHHLNHDTRKRTLIVNELILTPYITGGSDALVNQRV